MNRFRHGRESSRITHRGSQDFVESCILFILKKTAGHGYEITKTLRDYGVDNKATGPIYSMLNKMEQRGLITSQWDTNTSSGPARRIYNITRDGELYLNNLAESLQETVQTFSSFLAELNAHSNNDRRQ